VLAEALLEGALDPMGQDKLGRAGAWPTSAVRSVTTLALLRLRFKLTVHGKLLLVEEANALSLGSDGAIAATLEEARALLEAPATHDLASVARERLLASALRRTAEQSTLMADFAANEPRGWRKIMLGCGRPASMSPVSASKPCCRLTSWDFSS
jgi:hypothetical protein